MHPYIDSLDIQWQTHPCGTVRTAWQTPEIKEAYLNARVYFKEAGITSRMDSRTRRWFLYQKIPAITLQAPEPVAPRVLPLSNPEGLRPYQVEPVQQTVASLNTFGGHLNASDMGTGKTFVSLAAFRELGITPVVVAPATLLVQWKRAAEHLGMECLPISYEKMNRDNPYGSWTGQGKFLRFRWSSKVRGIIFDEAHRCKGTKTKAQKLMVSAARSQAPVDALTATGAATPLEMKALGVLLGLHDGGDFYTWAEDYGCVPGFHGGFEFSDAPGLMEKIHRQIFPAKGCRVRKEDLGDAFPETEFILRYCQLPEKSKKAIGSLYQDICEAVDELEKRIEDWKAPGSALSRISAMFQEIELLKAPALLDQINDSISEGYSTPVFVRFNATLDLLSKSLKKVPHGIFRGASSEADKVKRQAVLDNFQSDKFRALLTNYAAGSTGADMHDLHGNFPRAGIHSLTWNSRLQKQAFGRIQRDGGKTKSVQIIVGAAGTIEEEVLNRISSKLRNMDLLNDGDLLPEAFSSKLIKLMHGGQAGQHPRLVA